MADEAAAALFGIGSWRSRYEADGEAGLCSDKTGAKVGDRRRLSPSEEAAVRQTVLEFNPDELAGADLKRRLADRVVSSREQLVAANRSVLRTSRSSRSASSATSKRRTRNTP